MTTANNSRLATAIRESDQGGDLSLTMPELLQQTSRASFPKKESEPPVSTIADALFL